MDGNYAALGKKMATGAVWTIVMRFMVRAIGMVSTIILARLLVPEDFGLVAIASLFVALLETTSQVNLSTYLIRTQKVDRSYYDTAWTLLVARGGLIAIILVLAAPSIAAFYGDVRLERILYAMAGANALGSLKNIGIVNFQKFLQFDKDFKFTVLTKLSAFAVTILLAVIMRNYWALIIGTLSSHLAALIFSYTMHSYRPKFSLVRTREIIKFAKWLLANNILNFAQRKCDVAVIGKILDAGSLGIYSIARDFSAIVSAEIIQPLHRVLLPGLSKMADDREDARRGFLDGLSVIALLGLPLSVGIGVTADPLVRLALGPNWTGVIPILQVLTIVGVARICVANCGTYLLVLDQPHLTTVPVLVGAGVGIPLALWGIWVGGMMGAAWAASATSVLLVLVTYTIMWRTCGISPAIIANAIWRSIFSCSVMACVVWQLLDIWSPTQSIGGLGFKLFSAVLIGAITYIGVHLAAWRLSGAPVGAEHYALMLVRKFAKRFGRKNVLDSV